MYSKNNLTSHFLVFTPTQSQGRHHAFNRSPNVLSLGASDWRSRSAYLLIRLVVDMEQELISYKIS